MEVTSSVTLNGDLFVYNYSILNPASNVGALWSFGLDISVSNGSLSLSPIGLSNGQGYLANSGLVVLTQSASKASVPVGVQAPTEWVFSPSVSGTIEWGAAIDGALVAPGQTVQGFQITSPGLPAIRRFTARPYVDVESLGLKQPTDPTDLDRYYNDLAKVQDETYATGYTIGPTAPPANFVALDFLAAIQKYKEQSVALGWIINKGIPNSLDVKLNAAYSALSAGNTQPAKSELGAFINELNAQNGKYLTADAYNLLRFNVEYLIGKLK